MKTHFSAFIIIGMLALFVGCRSKTIDGDEARFCKSYIEYFYSAAALEGYQITVPIYATNNRVFLKLRGYAVPKLEYAELIEKYGDTAYNQRRIKPPLGAFSDEFTSIEVKSNRSFDAAHPAGTSLSDIVIFRVRTLYNFIQNGYNLDDYRIMIVEKELDKFTPDDLKLLEVECGAIYPDNPMISFDFSVPPPAGRHTLTVTFKTTDKTFTKNIDVNF